MKNKLNLALVAIIAVVIFCGCEQSHDYIDNGNTIWLDTISIHGQSHEILLRSTNPGGKTNAGGMMHSPECWCGKGGGR